MKRKTSFLIALAMAWSAVAAPTMFCSADTIELPFIPIKTGTLGDVNGDKCIDASDASDILADYACYSTSKKHQLSSSKLNYADVDKSGVIDASDASYVLAYYAYIQTGGKLGLADFLAAPPVTTTTTTAVTTTKLTTTTTQTTTQTQVDDDWSFDKIATSRDVFIYYANDLNHKVLNYRGAYMPSGRQTPGGKDAEVALIILNDGNVSDEVIRNVFSTYSIEDLENGLEYVNHLLYLQEQAETRVKLSDFVLDKEIGKYMDEIADAYWNGNIDECLTSFIYNNGVPEKCYSNAGFLAVTTSYCDKYLSDAEAYGYGEEPIISRISELVLGKPYHRGEEY